MSTVTSDMVVNAFSDNSMNFTTLVYRRPDINDLTREAKIVKSRLQNLNHTFNLQKTVENFQKTVDNYHQQQVLVEIFYYSQPTSEYWQAEYLFFRKVSPSVERLILAVNGWLRSKSALPELATILGGKFIKQTQFAHCLNNRATQSYWQEEHDLLQLWTEPKVKVDQQRSPKELLALRHKIAIKQNHADYLSYLFTSSSEAICTYDEFKQFRSFLKPLLSQILPWLKAEVDFVNANDNRYSAQFADLDKLLSKNLTLNISDLSFGLNSLANRLGLPMDFFLQAYNRGFIDIRFKKDLEPIVKSYFLPKIKQSFLLANLTTVPKDILALLKASALFYTKQILAETYTFTPLIDQDALSEEFISEVFVMASYRYLNVLYGDFAQFFPHWHRRYLVVELLYLFMLSEIQEHFYQVRINSDLQSVIEQIKVKYFPDELAEMLSLIGVDSELLSIEMIMVKDSVELVNKIIAKLAALTLVDNKKEQQVLNDIHQFIASSDEADFLLRLEHLGIDSLVTKDNLKRLVFQLGYNMGY